ncbi:MAG: 2-oxo acid dehydrogenase subunit E2 [Nitrospira sp.]|nr:2-oxo acid dehydrogenase subunit E2 [Nitrospira sp.]MDH4305073.1 2-oxo acid dehydrogenase subunit E2 [Nitrospira sp.]
MNVELPFLAEGIEGGDVVQLLVREGDHVTEGQSLIELETDKATVPVPTPAAGTVVRLLVQQGDHVTVGQALIELDGADGEVKKASPSSSTKSTKPSVQQTPPTAKAGQAEFGQPLDHKEAPPTVPPPEPEQPGAKEMTGALHSPSAGAAIPAPPSVRRLARELAVDLSQVKGSEAGGRITADDVKAFVRERTKRGAAQGSGSNIFSTAYGSERREPLPSLRRKIAANMTQAWTTIPHVHQFQEADITDLMALHKRYAPEFKKKGATLTLSSLFLKAIVYALKLYPQLNATLDLTNGEVIYKDYYNIGVAVDTPAGLIVPVVHQVDQKDLLQISLELADLAERTRKRTVTLEELRGATFTLSNMGGIGAGPFLPIINPPQVGILGVGKAKMTPVYRDGQFVPRRVLQLCVAYDHRLVDGAIGARFTNEIVKVLEDFQGMFLGL